MDEQEILALLASDELDKVREGAFEAGSARLEAAIPLLVQKLERIRSTGVQEAVDGALRKIGGKAVVHAVIPLLRSEDPPVRNVAMDVLREVGRSDVTALAELMEDDDPDIRIFGADILGSTGSAVAVHLLAGALLKDPEVNVRYQAAVSLGELAYPEAAEALNQALNDDEWVKFAVIEALIKVKAESSVGAMLKALRNSSDLVASNIVEALGEMGYMKAAPTLIERLPQCSGPLANRMVWAIIRLVGAKSLNLLGKEQHKTLVEYMLIAIEDEDEQIQDAAVAGLGSSGGEREFEAIFRLLASLNPERARERMLGIVKVMAGMGYHDALDKIMRQGEESERFLAVDIMSCMDDQRVVRLLVDVFDGQQRDVQRQAIGVLSGKAGPEDQDFFLRVLAEAKDGSILKSAFYYFARNHLKELIYEKIFPFLDHPYPDVQEAALEACMSLTGIYMRTKFIEMSGDENPFRRQMAYYAMRVYKASDILEHLSTGLKDAEKEVRRMAVESLGSLECSINPERLRLLSPCLDDPERDVRLAVIEVFGLCDDEESEKYLVRGLYDEDPWIRARCAESLAQKGNEDRSPEIARLLQDEEPLVVIKAIEALVDLGGNAAFRYLLPMVAHSVPEIQAAAQEAVESIRRAAGE